MPGRLIFSMRESKAVKKLAFVLLLIRLQILIQKAFGHPGHHVTALVAMDKESGSNIKSRIPKQARSKSSLHQ